MTTLTFNRVIRGGSSASVQSAAAAATTTEDRRSRLVDRMKLRPPSSSFGPRAPPTRTGSRSRLTLSAVDNVPSPTDARAAADRGSTNTGGRAGASGNAPLSPPLQPVCTPPHRAPPRQRRRKVPIKYRRLVPSPSPTPDRRHTRSTATTAPVRAKARRRNKNGEPRRSEAGSNSDGEGGSSSSSSASEDQFSSPIGTFGAFPSSVAKRRAARAAKAQTSRAAKRHKVVDLAAVTVPSNARASSTRGDVPEAEGDVSEISYFPTLALRSTAIVAIATAEEGGEERQEEDDDETQVEADTEVEEAEQEMQLRVQTVSSPALSQSASLDREATGPAIETSGNCGNHGIPRISFSASRSLLPKAPARVATACVHHHSSTDADQAGRQATELLQTHTDSARWTCLTNSVVERRRKAAVRLWQQNGSGSRRLQFHLDPPPSASVRQDLGLSEGCRRYRDTIQEWSAPLSSDSTSQEEAREEGAARIGFQSALDPRAPCFAGYSILRRSGTSQHNPSPSTLEGTTSSLSSGNGEWRARLPSPKAVHELVKLIVPISTSTPLDPRASRATWIDIHSTPCPLQLADPAPDLTTGSEAQARPLAWMPGTFRRFLRSLAPITVADTHGQRTDQHGPVYAERPVLTYRTTRTEPRGRPEHVTIYTTLLRLEEVRRWLDTVEVDAAGTRPFRRGTAGRDEVGLVVLDGRGEVIAVV